MMKKTIDLSIELVKKMKQKQLESMCFFVALSSIQKKRPDTKPKQINTNKSKFI